MTRRKIARTPTGLRETSNVASLLGIISMLLQFKTEMAIYFGKYLMAPSLHERVSAFGDDSILISYSAPQSCFDNGRTIYYGLFEEMGKRAHLRKACRHLKRLVRMDSRRCLNASPFLAFVVSVDALLAGAFGHCPIVVLSQ
jgi:hypothetical protein